MSSKIDRIMNSRFREFKRLRIFFEEPNREFNIREVSRILKISPTTISKNLKELSKKGILKERKERGFIFFKANLDSDLYRDLKLFYNIRKIKDSGFIEELNKFYLKPTIVFFGSGIHGLDIETSDFDFLVISEKINEFPNSQIFEKKLHRRLQLFTVKDIKNLKNKHLINNILNGIVLQGEIKWI